jgi:hypothetical protein
MSKIQFPRQENKKGGWTIQYEYLARIQKQIGDDADPEADGSLECIEAFLLAVEKVGLK